jgi:hypothetical protein
VRVNGAYGMLEMDKTVTVNGPKAPLARWLRVRTLDTLCMWATTLG